MIVINSSGGRGTFAVQEMLMKRNLDELRLALEEVNAGLSSLELVAARFSLSNRQAKRLWKRYLEEGPCGIEHRGKGRQSNRSYPDSFKEQVLGLYSGTFAQLGPTEFSKVLKERGVELDHETLRRWLISRNLWSGQRLKAEDCAVPCTIAGFGRCLNHLVIKDRWVELLGPEFELHLLRDEDTGVALAAVGGSDQVRMLMRLLWTWVGRFGIPLAVSCHRSLIADDHEHLTLEQELEGVEPHTAFAQVCDRLGVDLHPLNPARNLCMTRRIGSQIESLRFKLADAIPSLPEDALPELVLGMKPESAEDLHVPVIDGTDLRNIFCYSTERNIVIKPRSELGHGLLLVYRNRYDRERTRKITIATWLDGSTHLLLDGREVLDKSIRSGMMEQIAM
jgi:hypothetical protein